MDVTYETDNFVSNHSLETEYYDSSTVEYSEFNDSDPLTEFSSDTSYIETDLPDWRNNILALYNIRYLKYNLGWTITLILAYALIFFIGLVGNMMVILVVIKRPQMRTVTNILIMNLAVADLLVIIFSVPAELLFQTLRPWILGLVGCKGTSCMKQVSLCASAYSLAAISIDRCTAICRPQVPPRGLSKRQVLFAIGLIWAVSLTLTIPVAMVLAVSDHDRFPFCGQKWKNELYYKIHFVVVDLFLSFCWPLIMIVISNIIIWVNVSKRKAPVECAHASRIHQMHRKSRQSVGKMLGIVTLVFLLSWLPYYFLLSRQHLMNKYLDPKLANILRPVLPLLYNSNSSINPVPYAFLSKKFREAFKSLLQKWLLCNHRTESHREKSCSSRETITNDILLTELSLPSSK